MPELQPFALVVDDEPFVRMNLADVVAGEGYQVLEAADGEEAVLCLQSNPALRLLVTDIQMPHVDGLTLSRHVSAHWPGVRIILTSGKTTPSAGEIPAAASFIQKPFVTDRLVGAIHAGVDGNRS